MTNYPHKFSISLQTSHINSTRSCHVTHHLHTYRKVVAVRKLTSIYLLGAYQLTNCAGGYVRVLGTFGKNRTGNLQRRVDRSAICVFKSCCFTVNLLPTKLVNVLRELVELPETGSGLLIENTWRWKRLFSAFYGHLLSALWHVYTSLHADVRSIRPD